jgi:hypothetical protein
MCKGELLYCGKDHSEVEVSEAPRPSGNPLDEYPGLESGLFGMGKDGAGSGDGADDGAAGGGDKKNLMSKENVEGGIALVGMVGQGIKALSTEQGKACRAQCKSAGGLLSRARRECKRKCKSGEMMGQKQTIAAPEPAKTPWGLIIGGIVVLLIIVVVIVVVVMKRKKAA